MPQCIINHVLLDDLPNVSVRLFDLPFQGKLYREDLEEADRVANAEDPNLPMNLLEYLAIHIEKDPNHLRLENQNHLLLLDLPIHLLY
jgi:hypothetical protein